jgi:hypothetical protein
LILKLKVDFNLTESLILIVDRLLTKLVS